jgi:hypothetical protein
MAKDVSQHNGIHAPRQCPRGVRVSKQVRIDSLGNACTLAKVLEQLLDSGWCQRAVVPTRSPLEADEDSVSRYVARSSAVNVFLEPAGESRNRNEPLTGLASDPKVQIAIPVDEVLGSEVDKLTDPYAGVSQDSDHQLVKLGYGDVFERLDFLPTEYLKETLGRLWELRFALHRFAFGLSPSKEDIDRPQVAADRVSAQLGALVAVLQQFAGQPIEHPRTDLRQVGELVPLAEGQEDGDQRIAVLADGLRGEAASSAGGQEVVDQRFESHIGDFTVTPCDTGADTNKRKSRLWGCKKSVEASVRIQNWLLRELSGPGWLRTSDQPIMSRPL